MTDILDNPCPCCAYLTMGEDSPGSHDICPVCFWHDDGVQYRDPDFAGGANKMSLNQARKNFLEFGAISQQFIEHVRKPLPEEIPPE